MRFVVAIVVGVLASWVALLIALAVARPRGLTLGATLRIGPDVVGLVRRLAGDADLPRSVRITLWVLVGYLVVPFDLVPDFIPVLGYADDAIVIALALRRVVRAAGRDAVERHWRGDAAGLAVVHRLAGL